MQLILVRVIFNALAARELLLAQFREHCDCPRHVRDALQLVVTNDELVASFAAFARESVSEEVDCVVCIVCPVHIADVKQLFANLSDRNARKRLVTYDQDLTAHATSPYGRLTPHDYRKVI